MKDLLLKLGFLLIGAGLMMYFDWLFIQLRPINIRWVIFFLAFLLVSWKFHYIFYFEGWKILYKDFQHYKFEQKRIKFNRRTNNKK